MSVCYSTATATQYTTITASTVSTSRSHIISTLPASATTLTSSTCPPQTSGGTTGTLSCRTVTSVSSVDGATTTVQVPIAVTVITTSVSPLSTLYSTTCSSSTTTTTSQTTVSTSAASSSTLTTTSHSRHSHRSSTSTAATVVESSVATSAAASASSSSSDNTVLIIGAVVGGGLGLIIVVLLGWLLCRRRHQHRREVDYFDGDKPFDGNAMVRPTPYPFRDHNTGTGSSSGGLGFPTTHSDMRAAKSHSCGQPVPALDTNSQPIHRESDVDPASSFAPQTQISSATSPSLSVPTKRPSRSFGSVPTTSPSLSGVVVLPAADLEERPHVRTVASEGIPSASEAWSNLSQYHAAHPSTPLRGPGRSSPLSEKAQIHLHPDRGLTVVPHGVTPRLGPPVARDAAWRGQGQGNVSELDDHRPEGQVRGGLRGGGETGGSDAAAGVTRKTRRKQEEHGGDQQWEGEAPPAYCE